MKIEFIRLFFAEIIGQVKQIFFFKFIISKYLF